MKPKSKIKVNLINLSHEVKDIKNDNSIVIINEEKNTLELKDLENIEILENITDNIELNQKIKEKALEFANFSAKTNIWLGKHLTEVFDLLSTGNTKEESNYLKYLSYININERTARRYRKRYNIYKALKYENSKKLILTLSDTDIQLLEEKPELLVRIEEEKLTKEEFKNIKMELLIENAKQKTLNIPQIPSINIDEIGSRLENLYLGLTDKKNVDNEKLSLLEKYLSKIEKLLAE